MTQAPGRLLMLNFCLLLMKSIVPCAASAYGVPTSQSAPVSGSGLIWILLVAGALTAPHVCAGELPPSPSWFGAVGEFTVEIQKLPARFKIRSTHSDWTLTDPLEGPSMFEVGIGEETVKTTFGGFQLKDRVKSRWFLQEVEIISYDGARLELRGHTRSDRLIGPDVTLVFSDSESGRLRISLVPVAPTNQTAASSPNRFWIHWESPNDEFFFGLGEQYNRVRHRGLSIPIWVQEQGIGRHDGWPRLPFTGHTTDSLFPMPFAISNRGFGVHLDTSRYSVFHTAPRRHENRFSIESWDQSLAVEIYDGPRPRDILSRWTLQNGRPRKLPDWGFGVWVAAQTGPPRVRELLDRLKAAGSHLDAVWVQDWIGGSGSLVGYDLDYHWTWDPALYPNLPAFIAELHEEGIRFLGYFNSFIEPKFPEFAEAASRGFLVRDATGKPYVTRISLMRAGMVDLSNPAARSWLGGFLKNALDLGLDGWMADFGEWLPYDAKVHDPRGGEGYHNIYPVDWIRLNRETALESRPDGDFVIFNRAGYGGSARWVDHVWAGDQNTNWSEDDGLPTVIKAGLSAGLSGLPYFHFDAGGYTSLVNFPRRPELFQRWIEIAAFSPLLRTHEGYWRERNTQPDSNPTVMAHFARMSQAHHRLRPYLVRIAQEAIDVGLPMMRHLWLEYPADSTAATLEDEYLLGPDLLVAPVLKPRAQLRRLYLPPGPWVQIWTGVSYVGEKWIEVEAPLGQPPAFVRPGIVDLPVPLLPPDSVNTRLENE